jgi:hypothetical protein
MSDWGDCGSRQLPSLSCITPSLPEPCTTQVAAASVTHPAGSPKLAGTALTLLGGLAPWLAAHPGGGALEAALSASLAAAGSSDDKLSRNGATAAHRLCQCDELCAVVAGSKAGARWVGGLLTLYRDRGGLRQRAGACRGFGLWFWAGGYLL